MSTFAWARRLGAKATTPEPSPSPAYDAAIVRLGRAGVNGDGVSLLGAETPVHSAWAGRLSTGSIVTLGAFAGV